MKQLYLFSILVLTLFFIRCKKEDIIPSEKNAPVTKPETLAIWNGSPITTEQIPYQARIERINGAQGSGGGVIIGRQWILTAAHVVEDVQPNQLNIRLGLHDLSNPVGSQSYSADQIIIHPDYRNESIFFGAIDILKNDIALIHLSSPIQLNNHVSAILFADDTHENFYGATLFTVSGFGHTESGSGSPVLLSTTLKYAETTTQFIKAVSPPGEPLSRTDAGDSGGPLTYVTGEGRFLVGVVSHSRSSSASASYFTRVSTFAPWITAITGIQVQLPSGILGASPSPCQTSSQFSLNNVPAGANVIWEIPSYASATLSVTNNTATLNATANEGVGLTAHLDIYGNLYTWYRVVNFGYIDRLLTGVDATYLPGDFIPLEITPSNDDRLYTWYIDGIMANQVSIPEGAIFNHGYYYHIYASEPGLHRVKVEVSTKCNTFQTYEGVFTVNDQ
ncbi:serine protease [Niabella pedocola]|uniref:Serine protease n=1 Tax=Niabella pedocola TaxID=1752077 RepID=A0ABS8PSA0_9BACT|nr:serine protease [Niabella pedocola]MCD2423143.1 serine protease [Niabella pedocola]